MPYPAPPHDPERHYVSRSSIETLGLLVHVAGVLTDVDDDMTVTMTSEETNDVVFTRVAEHPETGAYAVTLSTIETGTEGFFSLMWTFSLGGILQADETSIQVGPRDRAYDSLDADMKAIVESVYSVRLGDLFDSDIGGPNLQTYYQTHYGRGRVAQLLRIAVGRLNTIAQPHQTFSLDSPGQFPVAQWGPLLEQACVSPETPVLKADLSWVPAGELVVGDRLVAFDEEIVGGKFRTAEVEANITQVKRRVRVETSLGPIITTPDHRFVTRYQTGTDHGRPVYKRRWVEAQNLRPGKDSIVSVGEPWEYHEDYTTGYLAGMMDGEGCLTFTPQSREAEGSLGRIFFTQNPGLVMEKTRLAMKEMGVQFSESGNGARARVLHVRGGLTENLRFLGKVRPVRLLANESLPRLWEGKAMRQLVLPSAEVLSVESIEDGPVSVMQTSTGTFIAQGMLSHNCYVETLKHLRRSYVEQPSAEGVNLARLDRRDYMTRWGEIIADEEKDLDKQLETFKIAHMGLGRGRVLVGGGIFGSFAPTRNAGMAARPRYWGRFY